MSDDPQPEEPTTTEPTPDTPQRVRLALISEVAFAAGDTARPIHALRVGTFTDMFGRESSFSADDLIGMADTLNAGVKRRKPPINEGHDMGRAVGRMTEAYTRYNGRDLYVVPTWNSSGKSLLQEEVYDGFSIELQRDGDGKPWRIIGGALTNYPAVSNLQPVTLSAPPLDDTPVLTPPTITEEVPMTNDEPTTTPDAAPVDMSVMFAQMFQGAGLTEQMRKHYVELAQEQINLAREEARLQAQREIAEFQARQSLMSYAQHVTTPTLQRPHALAYTADQVVDILGGIPADARAKVRQLIDDAIEGRLLVAYDPIGAKGGAERADAATEWRRLVASFAAQGMSQSAAIVAAKRANPELYTAYNKGGR